MEYVITAKTADELRTELIKWARNNAATRLNASKENSRTRTARRLAAEVGAYNDVADFLVRLKITE